MVKRSFQNVCLFVGAIGLGACTGMPPAEESETGVRQERAEQETLARSRSVPVAEEPPPQVLPNPIARARIIADILYDARLAHEDNRLTRPARDNAFDGYLEALRLDPENQVARQGIEDILDTYRALARRGGAGQSRAEDDYQRLSERVAEFERELASNQPSWSDYVERPVEPLSRARVIADTLYAAKAAYDDNRLTQPARDNAYDRYLAVLSMEPDNAVALAGIDEIVERYIQLAYAAMEIGQMDTAQGHLQSVRRIRPDYPGLQPARSRLEQARANQPESFDLDVEALASRSDEVQQRLAEIAHYLREQDTLFLIIARSDAEGRWIYQTMREAVEGYRLRGDIAVGDQPRIRISSPPF